MTGFLSTVRFLVKDGMADEFIQRHQSLPKIEETSAFIIARTGKRTFCFVGLFDDEEQLIAARPKMITFLDTVRELLEEISPELGVTDPVSGPIVHSM